MSSGNALFGANHPDTARARLHLAISYRDLGRDAEAEVLDQQA